KNAIIKTFKNNKNKLKNVVITGGIGFLGIHLLDEIIKNTDSNVYLVIRSKEISAFERLKNTLNYYFDGKYIDLINKRIHIIECELQVNSLEDILKDNNLIDKIDTVFNSAAHVKHFGNKELFMKINVGITKNLIDFCLKYNKKLIHISTLSVSGNGMEAGVVNQKFDNDVLFTEKDINVGQELQNIYSYSKYIAEVEMLKAISKGLNGTIIRTGNLCNRISDNKGQINQDNAFMSRIKFVIDQKIMPESIIKDGYMEISPVDSAASAIIKIACDTKYPVYHLYNSNHISFTNFINILKNININIDLLSEEEFIQKIYKDENGNSSILIMDIGKDNKLEYKSSIVINNDRTLSELNRLEFKWPKITDNYIIQMIKNIKGAKTNDKI
ncbi:MAG: SDR family oxidoreductase, partial [Clostridia bacterium]